MPSCRCSHTTITSISSVGSVPGATVSGCDAPSTERSRRAGVWPDSKLRGRHLVSRRGAWCVDKQAARGSTHPSQSLRSRCRRGASRLRTSGGLSSLSLANDAARTVDSATCSRSSGAAACTAASQLRRLAARRPRSSGADSASAGGADDMSPRASACAAAAPAQARWRAQHSRQKRSARNALWRAGKRSVGALAIRSAGGAQPWSSCVRSALRRASHYFSSGGIRCAARSPYLASIEAASAAAASPERLPSTRTAACA